MKTQNLILLIIFSFGTLAASAQSNHTQRPISKEVQKVSNKNRFSDEKLMTVKSTGYPSRAITKDVQLSSNHQLKRETQDNMVSTGYPEWTISKGVHTITPPDKTMKARFLSRKN